MSTTALKELLAEVSEPQRALEGPASRLPRTEILAVPTRLLSSASALVAVSLTHIRYKTGDIFGWIMGWFSLLPIFIAFGGFSTLLLFRRELQTFFFAFGLLISETTNQIIKQLVQEPRPWTCNTLEMCDSYGWPSSHSQFMLFFAVYLTLLATFKFQFSAKYVKDITVGLPWAFAPIVMLSRVYLGYHSVTQVLAGGSLGILLGSAWFWVVYHHFSPNFHKYENSKICRLFRVKDSSHIPDVIGFEYRCSRRARNRHQRAKLIKECERPKYHHHHRFCCHRCLRPSRFAEELGRIDKRRSVS